MGIMRSVLAGAGGAGVVIVVVVALGKWPWPIAVTTASMTYPELASVILTGVAVLITILGVFVATLAVWGYAAFKGIAKKAAKNHVKDDIKNGRLRDVIEASANEFLEREFSDKGSLRAILETRVDAIILSGRDGSARNQANTNKIELPNAGEESGEDEE